MEDNPNITIVGADYVKIGRGMTFQPATYESIPNYVEYCCHVEPGESLEDCKARCKSFVDDLLNDLFKEDIEKFYPARKSHIRKGHAI